MFIQSYLEINNVLKMLAQKHGIAMEHFSEIIYLKCFKCFYLLFVSERL